jgi:hypothetical protein
VECYKCSRKGHFAKFCRSSNDKNTDSHSRQVMIQRVKQVTRNNQLINVEVNINDSRVVMELDTASGRSFISQNVWKSIGSLTLQKSSVKFLTYTGEPFEAKGQFECTVEYNGQKVRHSMQVASGTCLFGRDLLNKLKMDWKSIKSQCSQVSRVTEETLNSLFNEYPDVFDDPVGRIKGYKA